MFQCTVCCVTQFFSNTLIAMTDTYVYFIAPKCDITVCINIIMSMAAFTHIFTINVVDVNTSIWILWPSSITLHICETKFSQLAI